MNWLSWITEPYGFDFMVRATIATIAMCIAAPICGIWALSRRLVYLTDAMSHGVLAGVAGAAIVGGSLLIGGLLAAIVMALAVSLLIVRARVPEDGAIGVVGQGLFAIGVIGVSLQREPRALAHVLFGNPLTVTTVDVVVDIVLALIIAVAITALQPVLLATTFDTAHARTVGMRVGLIDSTLLLLLSVTVVTGLVTVGVLMAVTLIVAPAVTGRLLARSLRAMTVIAITSGVLSGIVGLLTSYHVGIPCGPTVALAAVGQVLIAAAITRPASGLRRTLKRDAAPTVTAP